MACCIASAPAGAATAHVVALPVVSRFPYISCETTVAENICAASMRTDSPASGTVVAGPYSTAGTISTDSRCGRNCPLTLVDVSYRLPPLAWITANVNVCMPHVDETERGNISGLPVDRKTIE